MFVNHFLFSKLLNLFEFLCSGYSYLYFESSSLTCNWWFVQVSVLIVHKHNAWLDLHKTDESLKEILLWKFKAQFAFPSHSQAEYFSMDNMSKSLFWFKHQLGVSQTCADLFQICTSWCHLALVEWCCQSSCTVIYWNAVKRSLKQSEIFSTLRQIAELKPIVSTKAGCQRWKSSVLA